MLKNYIWQLFVQFSCYLLCCLVQCDLLLDVCYLVSGFIFELFGQYCLNVVVMDDQEIWCVFDSYFEGFNEGEVVVKIFKYGDNQILVQKFFLWWVYLWICYCNLFNLLLIVFGIVFYFIEDLFVVGVIVLMVGILILFNFIQEVCLIKVVDVLKVMVSNIVIVLWVVNEQGESCWLELFIDQLVLGDIIWLLVGDMILVDLCILQVWDLFVVQVLLIGELLLVEKVVCSCDLLQ